MRFYIAMLLGIISTTTSASELEDPNDLAIEIQAPLQAQDNVSTPPTVILLGLTVAVTTNAASTVHKSMLKGTEDPAFVPPRGSRGTDY